MMTASLVLRNARIYTQVRNDPWAEALAIYRDRIIWTGRDADAQQWIGPETEVIDAGRRLTLPGIIDSHFHLLRGARYLHDLQLGDARSIEDVQTRLRAFAEAHPDREWLVGQGWQYSLFAQGSAPSRHLLDVVVHDRPVILIAFDLHTAWANTAALERAGILRGAPTRSRSARW
jgi:predicted amidohydrolase YtcJ